MQQRCSTGNMRFVAGSAVSAGVEGGQGGTPLPVNVGTARIAGSSSRPLFLSQLNPPVAGGAIS
jgi:hypothetical protein